VSEGQEPEETAREALDRMIALPYEELEAAIDDGRFEEARQAYIREQRAWRRVEE
jgi:hypothetical protein